MLTVDEWKSKKREFEFPYIPMRRTGKTFRVLTEAATRASVGDKVVVFTHTHYVARDLAKQFADTFGRWRFDAGANMGTVQQLDSGGSVLFRGS